MEKYADISTVGKRIKFVREVNSQKQKEFAERLGVTQAHISKIEKGDDNPSLTLVKFICSEYFINEQWLLEGNGDMSVFSHIDETDSQSLMRKAENFFVMFRAVFSKADNKSQVCLVNALGNLISMIEIAEDTKNKKTTEEISEIMDTAERLIFNTSIFLKHSKNNYPMFLDYLKCIEKYKKFFFNNINKLLDTMLESSKTKIEYRFSDSE